SLPSFIVRNSLSDRLLVYEEPCGSIFWMPPESTLRFEQYCDPKDSPLAIEVKEDRIRIEHWLPPDEEINKARLWGLPPHL
ncbi:MAG TPA: hypothetical protein PKD72_16860, partial [Gemmatales bacterium]|nr:hypothetical protein [Gemmatales bacterium]